MGYLARLYSRIARCDNYFTVPHAILPPGSVADPIEMAIANSRAVAQSSFMAPQSLRVYGVAPVYTEKLNLIFPYFTLQLRIAIYRMPT